MKKFTVLLLVLAAAASLYSHPASKLNAVFDTEKSILNIDFEHQVKDRVQHYIFVVSVELNGKEIINQKLHSQDDLTKGSLVYKISDAKPGDKMMVKARCNKGGMSDLELTISKADAAAPAKAEAKAPANAKPVKTAPSAR